jgi:hypothetical protein
MRQWSVGEIVRYCLAFTGPEESFEGVSKEGLSETIITEARERPAEFAASAMEFTALGNEDKLRENPRYLIALFSGLQQAINGLVSEGHDSETIRDLFGQVLSSPVTQLICWVAERISEERDWWVPTWASARREAADLLLVVLERLFKLPPSDIGQVLELNQQGILRALVALQNSADPPGEDADGDPLMRCINSTRGSSLHSVIAFQGCLNTWSQSINQETHHPSQLHPGISELLEKMLMEERSPAVRCVFGWKLPYLHHLAPQWVNDHLEDIFPLEGEDYSIWRASWDAYVGFNPLFTSIWDLLTSYYVFAVGRLGQREYTRIGGGNPDENLGNHIFMAWFIGSNGAEPILASYLASSDDSLRRHLVWFGSRVLESNVSSKELSADSSEWERLERFWSERINGKGTLGVVDCEPMEASAFIHWLELSPAHLPKLKPLIAGIISRLSGDDHTWEATTLLEYLCSQSHDHPIDSAELMAALARGAWPKWLSQSQQASIITALRRMRIETGGEEWVKGIVDQLSFRHHFEYRQVLEEGYKEN